jgi:uncharacterized protein YwqG
LQFVADNIFTVVIASLILIAALLFTGARDFKRWKHANSPQSGNVSRRDWTPDFVFNDDPDDMQLQLRKLARDVIYLPRDPEPVGSRHSSSFLGGLPFGPADMQWPRNTETGIYYAFMGQLDVSSLPETDITNHFPTSGVLFFFLSNEPETTGKILHYPRAKEKWAEISPPDSVEQSWFYTHKSCVDGDDPIGAIAKWNILPTRALDFPSVSDLHFGSFRTDGETPEREMLCNVQSNALNSSAIEASVPNRASRRDHCHKIGGFPAQVQGDEYENDFDHYLLLELGADGVQQWPFDCIFQFWIKKDDLKNQRWENAFATHDGS